MKISEKGIELIKHFEGLYLKAYKCPAGIWTIGYGHTKDVREGQVITEQEATDLLKSDLTHCENVVNQFIKVPLNQGQYDSLVSFTFNLGSGNLKSSTLLKLLNNSDYHGASQEFIKWNKAAGKVLAGLTRRRESERNLFNNYPIFIKR